MGRKSGLKILIDEELRRRGLSLRDLAEMANMSVSGLSSLLNDPKKEPRLSTLASLAIALKLELRDLVEASGYHVGDRESNTSVEETRIQALVRSVPDIAPFLEHLSELTPDDRAAVLAVAEVLASRRRSSPSSE
jgi:transcriptional regulator with XRE-family HTH domain